jgi:hypothetical protein
MDGSTLAGNPFAVLTAIVAPAVLTNACSVLALGTGNRIARVVDRTRLVGQELGSMRSGSVEYRSHLVQLEDLQARAQFLLRALRLFYASLGAFAAAALISVLGSALAFYDWQLAFKAAAAAGLGAGVFAVGGVVAGCSLLMREVRLAIKTTTEEAELAATKFRSADQVE